MQSYYTHRSHEGRLSVGDEDKDISVKAMVVDPLIHIRVHVYTRTVHQLYIVLQQGAPSR